MKRTITSIITLIAISFGCMAQNVSSDVSRQAAVNFWNTYRPENVKAITANQTQLITFADMPYLHVYAVDGNGFVITSAYDGVQPVLAYSFDSPASDDLNPEAGYWLHWMNRQIAVSASEDYSHPEAAGQWGTLLTATVPPTPVSIANVPTLLTTRWNQSDPFNRLCPYDSARRERTVVGCVATAIAQVMKYWNHPSSGTGSHYYTPRGAEQYGEQSADFENTTYIWEYMPEELGMVVGSDHEVKAVSQLSYHCGVAVDMMYGPSSTGGSGAYSGCGTWATACAEHCFYEYFKYSPNLQLKERLGNIHYNGSYVETHYYSDSAWMAMLDADLALGRPMYYHGSDSTGGHAFVCDGSDLQARYHFNWGWGGSYDGFYAINDLSPRHGGAGGNATYTFNHNQGAIFGIVPVEEHFDSVVINDTACRGMGSYYHFHDYIFPLADSTYQAKWCGTVYTIHLTLVNSRTVYLEPNGGTGSTSQQSYCPIEGLVLPECSSLRNGYAFIGWGLKRYNNDTLYQPGDTLWARSSFTLYAQWSYINGIDDADDGVANVYPTPTNESVTVELLRSDAATINIVDSRGRVLITRKGHGGKVKIALTQLPAGSYTVMVLTSDGIYKKQIIKI